MSPLPPVNAPPPATGRRQEWMGAAAILAVTASYLAFGLRTAANSLGCDFLAYYDAAQHWLAGQPIYDLTVTATGTCGTYQYPPPFVLLAVPFSLFGFAAGTWLWVGFLIGCWAIGTAILPVRPVTRWLVLLLGAIGWPLIFGIRIGQVAPILYLLFAVSWRTLDRPLALGASVALGTIVKLQPGLLIVWLLVRREWRALAATALTAAIIAGAAAVVGLRDWAGLLTLLRSLTDAVTIPTNAAIGAALYGGGVDQAVASAVQAINTGLIVLVVVLAGLRLSPTPGLLVAILATQLISPIIWRHYALLLMLPVAWLLDRRQWWAVAIPVVLAWTIQPFLPAWTYTAVFYGTLVAVLVIGARMGDEDRPVTHDRTPEPID